MNNTGTDTLTIWVVDETSDDFAGEVLEPGKIAETPDLADEHVYYVSAISHAWLAKHNADLDDDLDPTSAMLYVSLRIHM